MGTANEIGFEGRLRSSIKPDGVYCGRRGGCDREALCVGEGECLGVDPRLANTLNRNRFGELAGLILGLTYAEMIEFAGGLSRLRGEGKVNRDTLPKILYAWATASDRAVHHEPAAPAGEHDCGAGKKFQPIDTAPKDRPILAFMLGQWRIARWKPNQRKRPAPFWSADDLRVTVSCEHQPRWWAELPPSPPEAAGLTALPPPPPEAAGFTALPPSPPEATGLTALPPSSPEATD
jgi:hypothetical protein